LTGGDWHVAVQGRWGARQSGSSAGNILILLAFASNFRNKIDLLKNSLQ
jgi:hypothetical protein